MVKYFSSIETMLKLGKQILNKYLLLLLLPIFVCE